MGVFMDHPEGAGCKIGRIGLILTAGCGWSSGARSSVRTAACW